MKLKIGYLFIALFITSIATAQSEPAYFFSKTIDKSFDETVLAVKKELKDEGFGTITEVDMDKKLKEKIDDVALESYKILGVCNPGYAYETIQHEANIGLFLPCKVLVKKVNDKQTEVVMVNPSEMMKILNNPELNKVADKVTEHFKSALSDL